MADAITIKALQDASLDAKSLEEVVNGNDTKQVTTRLGENYPSVKKAIKTLFENGGLPATPFETKALMTASALVDGEYAMVTDDTVNNGLYVKTSGAWVKSAYDPLTQAKAYADVHPDIAAGLAAVADGEQFQVIEGDEIVRYRRDSASTQTEVVRYPSAGKVQAMDTRLTHLDATAARASLTHQVGEAETPTPGSYAAGGVTRILLDPVTHDGHLVSVRAYTGGYLGTLQIKRFTKSGVPGDYYVGDVFTQVGDSIRLDANTDADVFETVALPTPLALQAGDYIGVYSSNSNAYGLDPAAGETRFVSQNGDLQTLISIPVNQSSDKLQLAFNIETEVLTPEAFAQLDGRVGSLEAAAAGLVTEASLLPAPSVGAQAVVLSPQGGPAWSDGVVWRWVRDNTAPDVAWMRIAATAQQDGWEGVYDMGNPRHMQQDGQLSLVGDALGNLADATQGDETRQPVYQAEAIGALGAAVFDGGQYLTIVGGSYPRPLFVMAVFQYDGAEDAQQFIFDGRTAGGRGAALMHEPSAGFSGWGGQFLTGLPTDNMPHVMGVQFNEGRSTIWADGGLVDYGSTGELATLELGRIGADSSGGRGWVGKVAVVAIHAGTPTVLQVQAMMDELMALSGVPKQPPAVIAARSAATVRVSDGEVLYSSNPEYHGMGASTSKLMTAVMAERELADLTATHEIIADDEQYPIADFLKAGDIATVSTLINAALIVSDNNAALALGRIIGYQLDPSATSTYQALAAYRAGADALAASLGLSDTTFTSPFTGNNTTALDYARFTAWIAGNAPFTREVAGKMSYDVTVTGEDPRTYTISHSVSGSVNRFPEFVFGKTGTGDSRGSLAMLWELDGEEYATMILESDPHSERYNDARAVLNDHYRVK